MRFRWIPNALTITRIAVIPFFGLAIMEQRFAIAAGLFFFAGLSDLLDGFLARRFAWQSRLGSLLDPIADKLLFATALLLLAMAGEIPWWLVLLALVRDIIIVTGATVYNFVVEKLAGAASLLGKVTTGVLGLYVLAVLCHAAGWPYLVGAENFLHWVAALCLIASGAHYVLHWSARARARRQQGEANHE